MSLVPRVALEGLDCALGFSAAYAIRRARLVAQHREPPLDFDNFA